MFSLLSSRKSGTMPRKTGNIIPLMNAVCRMCRPLNTKRARPYAAIEPINRYENAFLLRGEQALALIKKVNHPQIKMMLDFFHCNIEENNNGDAIRAAGKNLVHCHVADSNRKSCGRGMTNWFEIMRALKDVDFNGSMACEPLPPTAADVYASQTSERPEADQYAEECIKYLRFIQSVI